MDQVEFFQAVYAYLLISGNSYILQNGRNGEPQELYPLRPDRIRKLKWVIYQAYNYMLVVKLLSLTKWIEKQDKQSQTYKII